MKVDVLWTPAEWEGIDPQGRVAVVIDVLRSTSTIATALSNGARAILPAASTEDALQIARSIGRDGVLLCGERKNLPIEGFDLGNSPGEFGRDVVEGRTLVVCTTNGTRALLAATGVRGVVLASFLNLGAVVRLLVQERADPVIVCAGRSGLVGLDDVLCAGEVVARLDAASTRHRGRGRRSHGGSPVEMGEGAVAAQMLWAAWMPVRPEVLAATAAGRQLEVVGLADDIGLCARIDALSVVPVLENRQIVAKKGFRRGRGAR